MQRGDQRYATVSTARVVSAPCLSVTAVGDDGTDTQGRIMMSSVSLSMFLLFWLECLANRVLV